MKKLLFILRLALPAGLLYYLFSSGRIDLQLLLSVSGWHLLMLVFLMLCLQTLLVCWRWQMLLNSQGIHISLFTSVRICLAGMFYSTILPGSMGGDLVRALLVTGLAPKRKIEALSTLAFDRIIGLVALLMIDGLLFVTLLAFQPGLFSDYPGILPVFWSAMGLLVMAICGVVALLQRRIFLLIQDLLLRCSPPQMLRNLLAALDACSKDRRTFLKCTLISMLVQGITPAAFLIIGFCLGQTALPAGLILVFTPLVMTANALPISFMGIGVGEGAMISLFSLALAPDAVNMGGEMMIIYRLIMILVALGGVFSLMKPVASIQKTDS